MKYYEVTFFYRGEKETVILKEDSINEALSLIKTQYNNDIEIINIKETDIPLEEKLKLFLDLVKEKIFRKKLNLKAYISALDQTAVLVNAGISLKDTLIEVSENSSDPLVREIFQKSAEVIEKGGNLSTVMAEYEAYLGNISYAMIRLGEKTGDLEAILRKLAQIYEKMDENRRKVKKALRYPIITLTAITGAFVFLVTVVVPKFKSIFESLHADLPAPTLFLLATERLFREHGVELFIGIAGTIITLIYLYKTNKDFKRKMDALFLKVYLVKDIVYLGSLSRFLSIFYSLIESGLSVIESLKIASGVVNNEILKEKINYIIVGVNQGKSLNSLFEQTGLLDFIALRMIKAGEESGELGRMIQKASDYYEQKMDDLIDNIQSAIEPIVMIIIAGLVLLLALGIFLPMWDLASAAKKA